MPTHLFSEPWVQPREMLFSGQSGTHNTLKRSLHFCLNYNDKYQQQEKCIAMNATTWRQQTRERGQLLEILQWLKPQGPDCFSWTSWIYQLFLLRVWDILLERTLMELSLTPRSDTITKNLGNCLCVWPYRFPSESMDGALNNNLEKATI